MQTSDFGASATLILTLVNIGLVVFRGGRSSGDLERRMTAVEAKIATLAPSSSFHELDGRVNRMQGKVDEVEKTANRADRGVEVVLAKIEGLDRLSKHGFNSMRQNIEYLAMAMGHKLPPQAPLE